jgi:hypothetical protein
MLIIVGLKESDHDCSHVYSVHRDIRSGTRSLTQRQEDVLAIAIAGLRASYASLFRALPHFTYLIRQFSSLGFECEVWLSESLKLPSSVEFVQWLTYCFSRHSPIKLW